MIPVVDNAHITEALALLTDMFKPATNVNAILHAAANGVQQVENAAWEFINGFLIGSAIGASLDQYGAIVGVARTGRTDDDYRAAILLQIRINRASGLAEDVIQTAALILVTFVYEEYAPASFVVRALDTGSAGIVIQDLGKVRAAGTYGVFEYSSWPDGRNITWDDAVSTLGTNGFSDYVAGLPANVMIAAQELK